MPIWTIAKTTVGEAMRKKVLNICLIVAIGMIILSLSFSQLGFKQDLTIVKSLGLFVILAAGFVISLLMSVSLIPTEVERRTIYTILSKPVSRYQFVLGKFLGGIITLFINTTVMGLVFVIMVALKAKFGAVTVDLGEMGGKHIIQAKLIDPSLILGIVLIYFQFFLLSAVVILFSVFMTPTVNFFASTSIYIVGSAAQVWKAMADTKNEAVGPLVHGLYKVIYTVIPNFDLFNVQNRLIHPNVEVRSFPIYVAGVISYALIYALIAMVAAIIIFDRKEV